MSPDDSAAPRPGAAAVRQLWAEALARRAAAQPEPVRRRLAVRLAALEQGGAVAAVPQAAASAPVRGPLGRLADALARGDAGPATPAAMASGLCAAPEAALPELQALQRFRATWSRLAAEERVQQALAHVPPQAGPLNSSHLVYRALLLMRETAPEYLQRFVPYVDALLWLEQMQAPAVPPPATARRKAKGKPGKGRSA